MHVLTGGVAPALSSLNPESVFWTFSPQVPAGGWSEVLIYTSLNPPVFGEGSVINQGLSDQGSVPIPVPEPSTLILLMGGLAALRRRS